MSGYAVFWIVLAIFLGVIEAITVNLATIWFALGAVVAFVISLFCDSILVQVAVFTVVSVVAVIATRPIAKKLLGDKKVATNADRFIGEKALVIEDIDAVRGSGKVKARGQIWSAKPLNEESIQCGETVKINKIEGVRAVVSKDK